MFLSDVLNGEVVKPYIAIYLVILGVLILRKSFGQFLFKEQVKRVGPLGFVGGLVDAIGGGGWGPIVASQYYSPG